MYTVRSGTGRGGGSLWRAANKQTVGGTKWTGWWREWAGGRRREIGGRAVAGAGWRLRADGQAIAHRPYRVAVRKSRDRLCVIFVTFVLTNVVVLLNLKNRCGEGQPHVVNNGVAGG